MTSSGSAPPSSCPHCGTFLPEAAAMCPICGVRLSNVRGSIASAASAASPTAADLALVRSALSEDYDVLAELGRGGMAVVYRARERRLERDVAIKVLPFSRSADESFVERFQREARTAAQLEHPHIIPIHRVGDAGPVIYFAMQFVNGSSLAAMLREHGTVPPVEIRRLLAEVGSALAYAARRGVVHRDIKPDNILRDDESGRYLVTDFGIARSAHASRLTETGMSVGTPRYMSPEQASGKPLDGRSDIYSLGVVAYHCLTGRPPFDEGDSLAVLYAHVHNPVPQPPLATAAERALYTIVARMLAKDPGRRFQSGEALIEAVASSAETRVSASGAPTEKLDTAGAVQGRIDTLRPAVARAAVAVRRWSTSVRRETQRVWSNAVPRLAAGIARLLQTRPLQWITATRRRTIGAIVAAVIVFWGGKTAVHFATKHGSRCPTGDGAGGFSVMLDPVGSLPLGPDLEVYYDVCGLERGTPFTARLRVSQQAGGIRGFFGGRSSPVTVSFDERARGAATRRHRTIELPALEAGSYALELSVTTADGRKGSRRHDFQLMER